MYKKIPTDFDKKITLLLSKKIGISLKEIQDLIEVPPKLDMGDYSFPCFRLAKKEKKDPKKVAEQLSISLEKTKPKYIIKINSIGPYINFFIDKSYYAKTILKNICENYGKSEVKNKKKVVIDFSSPNVGKPMHIGHIRSTIIGDSLLKIHNFLGYETIGINYLGDIGLHIGKLIVAYELWVNKDELKKDPIKELLRLYLKFNEKEQNKEDYNANMDLELEESIDDESYEKNPWTKKAKQKLKDLELGDKKSHEIWNEIIKFSGKGFDRVYSLLKVDFHETTGQSNYSEKGKEIVLNAAKNKIAEVEHNTGAVYIDFEKKNKENPEIKKLSKKYILRSNGTASYITQDIGAAVNRYEKYKFNKIIYVTDSRQKLHFEQLFEILKILGYDFYKNCEHVGFGTVKFQGEIMATRKGEIVLLEEVLNKTIEKAKQEIDKRKTKGDPAKVGVGAVKYTILKNDPVKDIDFSWETALNFEGETGPYLQYSYARACSIIKKSKIKNPLLSKIKKEYTPCEKEIKLIKKIQEFPKIIKRSADTLNPSLIANYSFQLSQAFNEFYHDSRVIGSEQEYFRIILVDSFKKTLYNSLYLLGIEVMEEM